MSTRALVSGRIDKRRGRVTMRGVITTARSTMLPIDGDLHGNSYDENGVLV
jgi:hypothetical protein